MISPIIKGHFGKIKSNSGKNTSNRTILLQMILLRIGLVRIVFKFIGIEKLGDSAILFKAKPVLQL